MNQKFNEMTALGLAVEFHVAYEKLSAKFNYQTRTETRIFDPESPNGKLMIAVMEEVFMPILAQVDREAVERCAEIAHSFRKGNLSAGKLQDLLQTEPTAPVQIKPDGTVDGYDPAITIAEAIRKQTE